MTKAGQVAAEIPRLRRHAHALTGNWSRGDLYTRRVLRASDGDPGAAGQVSSARVGLYRTLHRFWARSGEAAADSVASRCRESMLLSRGAHFSPEEVAEILDLPADTVRGLARRAAAELADAGGRAALFLTDATAEENAATLSLLDACAVRCLGCARTPEAAADLSADRPADLLVADCGRNGTAAAALAAAVLARIGPRPVLFLTTVPAELMTCALPPAAWILPWPCPVADLRLAVDQLLLFHRPATT